MARSFNVFLANPAPAAERIGFSFITPRALPVLAAATPKGGVVERLRVVDQAVDEFPFDDVRRGDLVGISIHTFNAIHGYALGREASRRGATVVFGGPHSSIFPEEALRHGDAVVTGDGEIVWKDLLADHADGRLRQTYSGGRVSGESFTPARWDVMPLDRYLIASIQTVRGCPKSCSFCSVWVQDGRVPRVRATDAILAEAQYLYRAGFRLVMFADDNFYPYTLEDIAQTRSPELSQRARLGRDERLTLLRRLATEVPRDMHFCTQITMEVAEDPEFLEAMKQARIAGALIGIETITQEGLQATRKLFNASGAALGQKLEIIRQKGFPYILGSFIFGIESDTKETLDETIRFSRDCGIALAQFIPMTPLPGTVDFHQMRKGKNALKLLKPDYDYWLDPEHPRVLYQHPRLAAEQILNGIERAWKDFYSIRSIVKRAQRFGLMAQPRKFLAYLVVCRGLLTRYKRYGLSADSAVRGTNRRLATLLGRLALALMKRKPTPALASGGGV
ncbi:MAG TPA: radical SAM protein [Vicinamibacterales bacterium]|jgi:radical SAM superfamily enzyme YgiQ (UPF0313 family)|nr:radical SAM protein [Vicinamibacterales bacterium]